MNVQLVGNMDQFLHILFSWNCSYIRNDILYNCEYWMYFYANTIRYNVSPLEIIKTSQLTIFRTHLSSYQTNIHKISNNDNNNAFIDHRESLLTHMSY